MNTVTQQETETIYVFVCFLASLWAPSTG